MPAEIRIIAPTGAEVFLNQKSQGFIEEKELRLKKLAADTYKIEIKKPGFETLDYEIELKDHTIARLVFEEMQQEMEIEQVGDLLEPVTMNFIKTSGSLKIITEPAICQVVFRGRKFDKNKYELTFKKVPPGKYLLIFITDEKTKEKEIEIIENELTVLDIDIYEENNEKVKDVLKKEKQEEKVIDNSIIEAKKIDKVVTEKPAEEINSKPIETDLVSKKAKEPTEAIEKPKEVKADNQKIEAEKIVTEENEIEQKEEVVAKTNKKIVKQQPEKAKVAKQTPAKITFSNPPTSYIKKYENHTDTLDVKLTIVNIKNNMEVFSQKLVKLNKIPPILISNGDYEVSVFTSFKTRRKNQEPTVTTNRISMDLNNVQAGQKINIGFDINDFGSPTEILLNSIT